MHLQLLEHHSYTRTTHPTDDKIYNYVLDYCIGLLSGSLDGKSLEVRRFAAGIINRYSAEVLVLKVLVVSVTPPAEEAACRRDVWTTS